MKLESDIQICSRIGYFSETDGNASAVVFGALSQSYVWNSASSELFMFGKSSLLAELGYTPEFSTKAQDNSTVWSHTTCLWTSSMFTVFCTEHLILSLKWN